jgi:hypothetical protein
MRARDSRDRRYPERLAGSYIISIILHVLGALLLFAIASSSSQEGATESAIGGDVVSISQRAPVQPVAQPSAQPPIPHAPIAPVPRHAPVARQPSQRAPQRQPELSKIVPHASPLPKPIPQSTAQPNPQPTQAVIEPSPAANIPAVPISVPTAAAVAVSIKVPPTAAPSPAPTSAPTAQPTAKPQPSAAPTTAPKRQEVAARATSAPASPAPQPHASLAPAKAAGVPSPSPTQGATIQKTSGISPSPGPKHAASPGPHPGNGGKTSNAPRPITVPPSPAPRKRAESKQQRAVGKELGKLLETLPTGPVDIHQHRYAPGASSISTQMDPTPPPSVLAQTKFLYQTTGGAQARTKMWVTGIRKVGPLTMCTGWLVRWPNAPTMGSSGANGSQISIFGGPAHGVTAPGNAGQLPIIEANVTYVCSTRHLTPFTPP